MANILVACECSGRVREALRAKGHTVVSVDLDPAEDNSPHHIQGDVLDFLGDNALEFDMMIAHPPCTYLANSGARWLWTEVPVCSSWESAGPDDVEVVEVESRWRAMEQACLFFAQLYNMPIPKIAIENPIMHKHARIKLNCLIKGGLPLAQYVQPWWFGDKAFKATGFTLKGLPPLVKSAEALTPPPIHDKVERKAWSVIHNMSPGKNRAKDRSRTFPGIARAVANQWG